VGDYVSITLLFALYGCETWSLTVSRRCWFRFSGRMLYAERRNTVRM